MDLISVIVPVYNVEKYLQECINSILNQTYSYLEILLIDDGSTDGSSKLCDEYALLDERVKVIHKQNEGLGLTRNTGLKFATGKYVLFVDSDDYLARDMVETLYKFASEQDCDLCLCGYYRVYLEHLTQFNLPYNDTVFENEEVIHQVLLEMVCSLPKAKKDHLLSMAVWASLFKRELISRFHLSFYSERDYISEDILFNIDFLKNAKKVGMINHPLYYYRQSNVDSLTHQVRQDEMDRQIIQIEKIRDSLSQFLDESLYQLRLKRYCLAAFRSFIQKSMSYQQSHPEFPFNQCLKKWVNHAVIKEAISDYPYWQGSIKQVLFNTMIRFRMAWAISLLTKMNLRNKN